jgi:hypothetical protein
MARHLAPAGPGRAAAVLLGAALPLAAAGVLLAVAGRDIQPMIARAPAWIVDNVLSPVVFALSGTEVLGWPLPAWGWCLGAVMVLVGLAGLRVRWGWRLVDRLLDGDGQRGTDAVVAAEDAALRQALRDVEAAGDGDALHLPAEWAGRYGGGTR